MDFKNIATGKNSSPYPTYHQGKHVKLENDVDIQWALFFVRYLLDTSLYSPTKIQRTIPFRQRGESINHLLCMDDLKLYGKDERELDALVNTVRVFSNDI